jgi:hypothetical protein
LIENSRQFAKTPKKGGTHRELHETEGNQKGVDFDLPTGMNVPSVMLQCFRRNRYKTNPTRLAAHPAGYNSRNPIK